MTWAKEKGGTETAVRAKRFSQTGGGKTLLVKRGFGHAFYARTQQKPYSQGRKRGR